jgi:hypothetical protein
VSFSSSSLKVCPLSIILRFTRRFFRHAISSALAFSAGVFGRDFVPAAISIATRFAITTAVISRAVFRDGDGRLL